MSGPGMVASASSSAGPVALEVEAEVRQALRRQDRLVDVGAGQELARRRVEDQVRVGVDALVAAVAALGIDAVAGRGERVGAGGAGVVLRRGRRGLLRGHGPADGVAAGDLAVARAGGAGERAAGHAARRAGGQDPRALEARAGTRTATVKRRVPCARTPTRGAADHPRRPAAVQQPDGHAAVRDARGRRCVTLPCRRYVWPGDGVRGQRLDPVDRHERARSAPAR